VSWTEAQEFCAALTKQDAKKPAGWEYTLPTEAEWEYACRAGTQTAYSFGNDSEKLGEYAWFSGNSGNRTHEVGGKKPNPWGLYDMHGNVWQWCVDGKRVYQEKSIKDPKSSEDGRRALRGGSLYFDPRHCRAAYRFVFEPGYRSPRVGFRVVLRPGVKTP
jgi:formylglycine-generating enzyme required for sulfatase activity